MYLILNVHSSNEHYGDNCDYAIVEVTPAVADQIRRRVTLARQAYQEDDDLYVLRFWGSMAEFYDHNVLEACQDAVAAVAVGPDPDQAAGEWLAGFEQREYAVVPEGLDVTGHEAQRTECDQVLLRVISSSGPLEFAVAWTAVPKHSDVDVTTSDLSITVMEDLLAARIS